MFGPVPGSSRFIGIGPAFDDITKFSLVNEAFLFLFSPRTCAVGCKRKACFLLPRLRPSPFDIPCSKFDIPLMLCLSPALPALRSLGEGGISIEGVEGAEIRPRLTESFINLILG